MASFIQTLQAQVPSSIPNPNAQTTGTVYFAIDTLKFFIVQSNGQVVPLPTNTAATGPQGATGATGSQGQGLTWRGAYNPGNTYAPYDLVIYTDGSTYICTKEVGANSGNAPGNTEYWNLVAQSGTDGPVTSIGTDASGVNEINGQPINANHIGGL
jgi:hypothetical protein